MKYQIAIIGGGPAGYTAAEAAGKAGLSVVLFEKRSLGGVCLNEGCIPTKTLLYSAKVYDYAKHASKYAVNVPEASFDLGKIVARKSKVVRKLVLGIKAKLTAHQVNIVTGEAVIVDKNTIQCGGETYECENLLLCMTGSTRDYVDFAVNQGVKGIVIEGFGRGNVPPAMVPGIADAIKKGIAVILTTRTPGGRVLDVYGYPGSVTDTRSVGIAAAGEISAAKARLKLMVVLSEHPEYATQRDKLEEIFDI